jgi:hypothetical protein
MSNEDEKVYFNVNPTMNSASISINRPRKYYPTPVYVPPVINLERVQDVGKDKNLRKQMTHFFQQKLIKWMSTEKDFYSLKKYNKFIGTNEGLFYVYHLLSTYVENSAANWYDLTDFINYPNLKKFLKHKLSQAKL